MIDLHCHLLPSIDDGATDLDRAKEMARLALADGITVTACTPHILPGVYANTGPQIRAAIAALQQQLLDAGIRLRLVTGADVHLVPDLVAGLRAGRLLTLNDSRYFLLEPPHHIAPPRLGEVAFSLMTAGYVPILTHPERLSWVEANYRVVQDLSRAGVWMQLTAGSVTGRFGRRALYWAERMLDDGIVHILATDAHDLRRRPPILSEARELVAQRLGEDEATHQVLTRPMGVLDNADPSSIPAPVGLNRVDEQPRSLFRRAFANAF